MIHKSILFQRLKISKMAIQNDYMPRYKMLTSNDFTLSMPEMCQGKNVVLKVQEPPKKIIPSQTFQSFAIPTHQGTHITIKGRNIEIMSLHQLLVSKGMSKTVPMRCRLDDVSTISTFDWKPASYTGPNAWHFKWNSTDCSITGNNDAYNGLLYLRIHDMSPDIGRGILRDIMEELYKMHKVVISDQLSVYVINDHGYSGYSWTKHSDRPRRSIETIYLDSALIKKLVNQIDKFYQSSEFYDKYGVTWKRVHLFHGPPGTGKTSTILALASHFKQNIAKITITPNFNSQNLEKILSTVPEKSVLVLEDVDSLFVERGATASIDFSTLLNCMDGVTTKRGMVCFMTTNHLDNLDPALIRPGRVDMYVKFDYPDVAQIRAALRILAKNFEHEHDEFIKNNSKMSIAEIQQHLFECHMDEKKTIL